MGKALREKELDDFYPEKARNYVNCYLEKEQITKLNSDVMVEK